MFICYSRYCKSKELLQKGKQVNIDNMKASVAYSNSQAFASKWLPQLSAADATLVEAFAASLVGTKSMKAIASYKSLVARFLVTNKLSEGKSGDSQKSAVRAFIKFVESLEVEEIDEA